jgi:hypothetical protein
MTEAGTTQAPSDLTFLWTMRTPTPWKDCVTHLAKLFDGNPIEISRTRWDTLIRGPLWPEATQLDTRGLAIGV